MQVQYLRKMENNHIFIAHPEIMRNMNLYPCDKQGNLIGNTPVGALQEKELVKEPINFSRRKEHISEITLRPTDADDYKNISPENIEIIRKLQAQVQELEAKLNKQEKEAITTPDTPDVPARKVKPLEVEIVEPIPPVDVSKHEALFIETAKTTGVSIRALMIAAGLKPTSLKARNEIEPIFDELTKKYKKNLFKDGKRYIWQE